MNNQDELFILCKQVYEVTGWEPDNFEKGIATAFGYPESDFPIYTSDYLLEKLPGLIGVTSVHMDDIHTKARELRPGEYLAGATYQSNVKGILRGASGDTPLKALLKLTLKLHKEGLL